MTKIKKDGTPSKENYGGKRPNFGRKPEIKKLQKHCYECGALLENLGIVGAEKFSLYMGYGRQNKYKADGTRNLCRYWRCPNKGYWFGGNHDSFGENVEEKQSKTTTFPSVTWVHKDLEDMVRLWGTEKTIKEIHKVLGNKERIKEVVEEIAKRISLTGYVAKDML